MVSPVAPPITRRVIWLQTKANTVTMTAAASPFTPARNQPQASMAQQPDTMPNHGFVRKNNAPRPSGRAYLLMPIYSTMAQRPFSIIRAAGAIISVMESNRANFMPSRATIAKTPIVPIRLSRMISSLRSFGRLLMKPSAVSASPSR